MPAEGPLHHMNRGAQFAICVGNKGYPASLELRKIYQVIPDRAASAAGLHQLRVIDEAGEDYVPRRLFRAPATATGGRASSAPVHVA